MSDTVQSSEDESATRVLLLKTKSSPSDGYEEYFKASREAFEPIFLPVLQHRLYDSVLDWLREAIAGHRIQETFDGIIFTSQKAVEAFSKVVNTLDQSNLDSLLPRNFPLYAVGPATANALRAIGTSCPVLGEETGNGELLADFILNDYQRNSGSGRVGRILFLVGEQRRDIIPKKLQSDSLPMDRRIEVVEQTVYEIAEREAFASDFASTLGATGEAQQTWIVVFSPTGCEAMLRTLGWLDGSGQFDETRRGPQHRQIRVATIGPTTFDFLRQKFGFEADVCAGKPNPDSLGQGILDHIQTHSASAHS